MLKSIDIKNIAVIESLSLDFKSGMTVLTGETGAGKSIIIDSINLILGSRSDKGLVRHGTEKAYVNALFDAPPKVRKKLEELDIDVDDELVISRTLSQDGKSTARINGFWLIKQPSEILHPSLSQYTVNKIITLS